MMGQVRFQTNRLQNCLASTGVVFSAMHHQHRQPSPHLADIRAAQIAVPEPRWTYHFATTYVERGYSVISLLRQSKAPAIAWKKYQSERPTETELRMWFKDDRLNVGIVTGKISSLVVVDADSAEEAAWWRKSFPETPLVVATGRGGSHFYYRLPENTVVGNRARVFGRAIDIRGEGGFVCAPPSIHQNGNAYTWASVGDDYCLADVPVFDNAWLPTTQPHNELDSFESTDPRSSRTVSRIRGLIRYLDKDVKDRSARDWAVVQGLRRLGCSPDEIVLLIRGHSKFRDEAYLQLTLANAFKKHPHT